MKKKKRKNKITKADTSDYYTEVFSKGKKLKKTSDKEESTLSDKFQELPWWAPPLLFGIGIIILSATVGIQYWFFFMMGGALIYVFMVFLVFILMALGIIRSFP